MGALTLAEEPTVTATTPTSASWAGVIGVEGELTGDGRLIQKGALRWDDTLPAPMRYVSVDTGAHDGAQVVGRIQTIERRPGGKLWATGDFDMGSEVGREAYRVVKDKITNGVSMDLDDVSFEIRVAADLLEGEGPLLAADDGDEGQEVDDDGLVTVVEINSGDEVMVTTDARVRAATIVAIPAFASATIEVTGEEAGEGTDEGEPIAASGARRSAFAPPAAWFADPQFKEVTPLTVTDDGRVYGHVAAWDTCHISYTPQGQCIQPPRNHSGYSYFHLATLRTAEGKDLPVGKLIVDTRHAGRRLNAVATMAHYEDTGAAAAFVRAGEDAHGIWVAGAVNPDASPKQVRALRSSPLSGDWRPVGNGMEMVAAIAVNVAGFPIPRPQGLVADGRLMSLVASGMVPPKRVARPGTLGALSEDDLRYLKVLAQRERSASIKSRADALAARVRATMEGRS